MAENWGAVAIEVGAALAEAGFTVTHRRVTNAAGVNQWTPGVSTTVNTNVSAVVDSYSTFEIDGTLIKAEDKKLLVPASVGVVAGDFFVVGTSVYRVVNNKPLEPGGVTLMQEVQLRK